MKKVFIAGASLILMASHSFAQSSVTLYGIIDEGFQYTSNTGGKSSYQLADGSMAGDRWGLLGNEDLGGGLRAVFRLENGFNLNSGTLGNAGRIFGRQAYVGVASNSLGTLTFGRQYDSFVDFIAPLTSTGGYAGWAFTHPFDNDNAVDTFRVNNSVKYTSTNLNGLTFGGLYGLSNQTGGFANNRAYSLGATYSAAALTVAAAYMLIDNPGQNASGALANDDTNFTARKQQVWGGALKYVWASASFGLIYTHTSLDQPTSSIYAGNFSVVPSSLKFDNIEANMLYQFTPALSALLMYTYTNGTFDASQGTSKPHWHQAGLMVDYYLSRRTDIYALAVYQRVAGGLTGTFLDNADITGGAGPSSGRNQTFARIGLKHTF
ncbi:porin [Caballeronia sp. LjRoot34]|uniref:porin n=1 Tax=Caballeronia sp. LjRoot34 TaxID=3342325 RepID=UPI003ED1430F